MKLYKIITTCFLLIGLSFNSCVDEEIIKTNDSQVKEGIPVTTNLSFVSENASEEKVTTRSALSPEVEYKVQDLYVFVFKKASGGGYTYETSKLFKYEDIDDPQVKNINGAEATSGKITLDLTSGEKKIFAIANLGEEGAYKTNNQLNQVKTIDELKELSATLTSPDAPVDRQNGLFLMSGSFSEKKIDAGVGSLSNGTVTINTEGKLLSSGKIYLKRLDSRITFNITTNDTTNKHFTPKGYRVVNVPVSSYLFERAYKEIPDSNHDHAGNADDDSRKSYYNDTKPEGEYVNFDAITPNSEGKYIGGSFTFYMFENRKPAKATPSDYNDRERQEKIDGKNGEYLYAHKYATYVEIEGSYYEKYTEKENPADVKEKSAEVKYTIHLGYVENASDFRSLRNYAYTYNVTIAGVNSIEVEVETSNDKDSEFEEKQPGAEGHVVKSKQFYYVDAHYITDKITFNKDNISRDASFRVKTPFDPDGRGDNAIDYEWVWFVQNEKIEETGKITKYRYSQLKEVKRTVWGGYETAWGYPAKTVTDLESGFPTEYVRSSKVSKQKVRKGWYYAKQESLDETLETKFKYKTNYSSFPKETAKRINIKDLITRLKENKDESASETSLYDSEGNAVFTIFIDEYYYDEYPPQFKKSGQPHWSEFANKENREMHILCDTEFSLDEESSLTTSNFLISQKSIKTFYNTSCATAWGVESVNEKIHDKAKEDGRLPFQNYTTEINTDSRSNGLYNMYNNLQYVSNSTDWSTYINMETNELKTRSDYSIPDYSIQAYKLLQYACLQRNRDSDGDGKIDNSEVRWYMPAVNQLTGLFLGKDALPSEVHLMQNGVNVTLDNRNDYHYTNSNNIMFWAEEGTSIGHPEYNNGYYNYRCVRNLGIDYRKKGDYNYPPITNEVQDYVDTKSNGTYKILDLTAVNPNALRATPDKGKPLAITDELSEYNRPYKKFLVSNVLTTETVSKESIYENRVTNPCPSGWRMPNMRELSLILAYSGFSGNAYSATTSSLSYKRDNKTVFQIQDTRISLGDDSNNVPVRCIKDIE